MPDSPGGADQQVTEVEFRVRDAEFPFVGASGREDCVFQLVEMVPRAGDRYAEFFEVRDVEPERVVDLAARHEGSEARLLDDRPDGGLFEFVVADNCPAVDLAEQGALPREVHGDRGEGHIVAEIPPTHDAARVVAGFRERHPEVELVAKREKATVTPPLTAPSVHETMDSLLTDRQREVLRAAYDAGYYDWPREATGESVAAELGISSATFSEHVHAAERKLLGSVFED